MSGCIIPGCKRLARSNPWALPRGRSGRWCEHHRQRARRHGDPLQPAIQTKTLRPLIDEIKRVVARDTTGKIEAVATQLSHNLREYVEQLLSDVERGRLVARWTARGAGELLRSLTETKPLDAACAAGALFLLRDRDPLRFVSETGWLHEFCRAWRKCCGKIALGSYWDHRWNRVRPVYRELPLRVAREIGLLLVTTYAPFAGRLIALEHKKAKLPETIRSYLDDGFKSVEENNKPQQGVTSMSTIEHTSKSSSRMSTGKPPRTVPASPASDPTNTDGDRTVWENGQTLVIPADKPQQ